MQVDGLRSVTYVSLYISMYECNKVVQCINIVESCTMCGYDDKRIFSGYIQTMEFVEKQNDLMLKALILNYRVLTWLCFQATIFLFFNLTSYIGHMSVSLWDNVSHTFMTSVWHWLLASISKLYFHYEFVSWQDHLCSLKWNKEHTFKLMIFKTLLLQNHQTNYNQDMHKAFLGKGNSSLYKWRAASFSRWR